VVLSAIGSADAAEVASQTGGAVPTKTSLTIRAGTLAQPVTLTATVRADDAAAGSPTGTVEIRYQDQVIATMPLSPTTTTAGKNAVSEATGTFAAQPGGPAFYFGKHQLTAVFVPSGEFAPSAVEKTFTTRQPKYVTAPGGVKFATIAQGSGAEIQIGQTASVLYTGYLAKNGQIFDDSVNDGGSPLSFTMGGAGMIAGFEEGTAGMKVGETRIISIPPKEGYGNTAVGVIPANSTLIFVVTLESIS
jgi:FKBP-type peptidyl-prolyl cis-trans isomerase FkpA